MQLMRNLLFICSQNRLRSPTAEAVFADYEGVETDSAGISNDADIILSEDQIEWADYILVMESIHRQKLNKKYSHALKGKKVSVLNIPDDYEYMEEAVVEIFKRKCQPYLS